MTDLPWSNTIGMGLARHTDTTQRLHAHVASTSPINYKFTCQSSSPTSSQMKALSGAPPLKSNFTESTPKWTNQPMTQTSPPQLPTVRSLRLDTLIRSVFRQVAPAHASTRQQPSLRFGCRTWTAPGSITPSLTVSAPTSHTAQTANSLVTFYCPYRVEPPLVCKSKAFRNHGSVWSSLTVLKWSIPYTWRTLTLSWTCHPSSRKI